MRTIIEVEHKLEFENEKATAGDFAKNRIAGKDQPEAVLQSRTESDDNSILSKCIYTAAYQKRTERKGL